MKQLILMALILALASVARSDDTGAKSPGTSTEDASAGWSNVPPVDSVATSDDRRSLTSTQDSLFLTNFSMGVPDGVTITAIIVEGEAQGTASQLTRRRLDVHLVKNGRDIVGDHVLFNFPQGTDGSEAHVGGTDSLWGESWTAAEVNESTFGIAMNKNVSQAGDISVDHFFIIIHFTDGVGVSGKRRRDMINHMPINITPEIESEFETWEQIAFNDFFKSQQRMVEEIR